MKQFWTALILGLILITSGLKAQSTGVIQGTIKDKNTLETLIGVVVQIEGTTLGATSDLDGNYKISFDSFY